MDNATNNPHSFILRGWKARSIDFMLAFPQVDMKSNVFMRIPFGFKVSGQTPKLVPKYLGGKDLSSDYLLRLKKNVYGVKDAARTWHMHLRQGLKDRGFTQSKVDPCVFLKKNLILVIYVDDVIAFCPDEKPIDEAGLSIKIDF